MVGGADFGAEVTDLREGFCAPAERTKKPNKQKENAVRLIKSIFIRSPDSEWIFYGRNFGMQEDNKTFMYCADEAGLAIRLL